MYIHETSGLVFCVAEADIEWDIEWPLLLAGDSITVPCGVDFLGKLTRYAKCDHYECFVYR